MNTPFLLLNQRNLNTIFTQHASRLSQTPPSTKPTNNTYTRAIGFEQVQKQQTHKATDVGPFGMSNNMGY